MVMGTRSSPGGEKRAASVTRPLMSNAKKIMRIAMAYHRMMVMTLNVAWSFTT